MPYIAELERYGDMKVMIVDGKWVRDHINVSYTDFGQPLHCNYIPKDEMWIDVEQSHDESRYYIIHMLEEYKRMKAGDSYEEALKAADKKERAERGKVALKSKKIPNPEEYQLKILRTLPDGIKVYLADGKKVRDNLDIEYTEGGHDLIYKYIPKDTVWIDDDTQTDDIPYILFHELFERNKMKGGMKYEEAHRLANINEHKFRAKSTDATIDSKELTNMAKSDIQEIVGKWDTLNKAISHKTAISSSSVISPKETKEFPKPSAEHLANAKYGVENIPGALHLGGSKSIGFTGEGDSGLVIRHGAGAHRTAVEHEMAKLLDADSMVANQSYDAGMHHPEHYQKPSYDRNLHGGTSIQEMVDGEPIYGAADRDGGLDGLRNQWKNGDLHKLWALHYISNNSDMHGGNFKIGKDGVKAFDSDRAFYELPTAHSVVREGDGKYLTDYSPLSHNMMPTYLHPFIKDHEDSGENIDSVHESDQPSSQTINEYAKGIDPEAFKGFGKHAYERATKAKAALLSADPTAEMKRLWFSHNNKTTGIK